MVAGLDSSADRPTAAIADQARAAGVGLWSGYIATKANVNLYSPWDLASFDNARRCGGKPIAFCSGLDDPVAVAQLAANWNVRPCLDVESGIRADGDWVQPWLDASGAGLYGQHYQDTNGVWHSIHLNRRAAFHVMSWYIGRDPGATWIGPQPTDGAPLGWQWQGGHQEFGLNVDRGWYDDSFGGTFSGGVVAGGFMLDYSLKLALVGLMYFAVLGRGPNSQPEADQWAAQIGDQGQNAWQVLQTIAASAEAQKYATPAGRIAALEAAVKGLTSAPVGQHTHPFTGSTGQPS